MTLHGKHAIILFSGIIMFLIRAGFVLLYIMFSGGVVSGLDCPISETTFEIVTGFVYSSPVDILESLETLMLSDCIEQCHKNDSCQSVNFETGLCVLFSSSSLTQPGKCHMIYT